MKCFKMGLVLFAVIGLVACGKSKSSPAIATTALASTGANNQVIPLQANTDTTLISACGNDSRCADKCMVLHPYAVSGSSWEVWLKYMEPTNTGLHDLISKENNNDYLQYSTCVATVFSHVFTNPNSISSLPCNMDISCKQKCVAMFPTSSDETIKRTYSGRGVMYEYMFENNLAENQQAACLRLPLSEF